MKTPGAATTAPAYKSPRRPASFTKTLACILALLTLGINLNAQARLTKAGSVWAVSTEAVEGSGEASEAKTGGRFSTTGALFSQGITPLFGILGLVGLLVLGSISWNLRLKRAVFKKTVELQDLNRGLKSNNDRLTAANAQLIMDMEERARLEEERRRLETRMIKAQNHESLALLAGGVAQNFNNLLNIIIGNIETALDNETLQGEAKEYLVMAINTAMKAGELAKDMLDYSGKTAGSRELLDLSAMAGSMTRVLEAVSPHQSLLRFQLEEQPVMVLGNPVQLRQLIVNLVLNAAQSYEPDGSPELSENYISLRVGIQDMSQAMAASIRVGPELPPGSYAFIEVSDQGNGIEPESMARLFDPFYSAKKQGLGLAAAAGIVQVHAGAIAVHSVPRKKTIFTVFLPLATENTVPVFKPRARTGSLQFNGTILLVEDQDEVRNTTARMLESLGLEVLQANSSVSAAAILRQSRENLRGILLDLTLGSQDSQTNFKMIRELAGKIPVIMTTGYTDDELRNLPYLSELAGVLEKPYDRPMLERAILGCFPDLGKTGT